MEARYRMDNNMHVSLVTDEMLERERLIARLDELAKAVDSWPEWKRNVLVNAGKSRLDVPRQPVDPGTGW